MKSALVLGLGKTGQAVTHFLKALGWKVIGYDDGKDDTKPKLPPLSSFDLVVVSPGVPPTHPIYQQALLEGIHLISEVELALQYLKNRKMIGITGTNGKSTVTLLTTHLLEKSGRTAKAVGNIGSPLIQEVLSNDQDKILVIELSSFQLERVFTPSLLGGAILNITPDHLDRYSSIKEYAKAKENIKNILLPTAPLFLNRSFEALTPELFKWPQALIVGNGTKDKEEENISAAKALVKIFGVTDLEIESGLVSFKKPPHRVEKVREKEGVVYIDDSKATNIDSTLHALSTIPQPIHLIVGGVDKGFEFSVWAPFFKGKVKGVYLIGQAAKRIEIALGEVVPCFQCGTLKKAVELASRQAENGEVVLLSPGCSSYDQFKDYIDRGNQFRSFVESL